MPNYDPDPLGLDKDTENVPIPECDWKLIAKLTLEFHEIERLFGPVPKKYKKYFKKKGMTFMKSEELL